MWSTRHGNGLAMTLLDVGHPCAFGLPQVWFRVFTGYSESHKRGQIYAQTQRPYSVKSILILSIILFYEIKATGSCTQFVCIRIQIITNLAPPKQHKFITVHFSRLEVWCRSAGPLCSSGGESLSLPPSSSRVHSQSLASGFLLHPQSQHIISQHPFHFSQISSWPQSLTSPGKVSSILGSHVIRLDSPGQSRIISPSQGS